MVFLNRRLRHSYFHGKRDGSLNWPIRGLLRQGFHGGFLIIDVGDGRFLQLAKYIRRPKDYGIELGFPRAKWSEKYYDPVRELCAQENVSWRVERGEGKSDPLDFLFVDFGPDDVAANKFVVKILREIFHIDSVSPLYCRLENASPENRLIDA